MSLPLSKKQYKKSKTVSVADYFHIRSKVVAPNVNSIGPVINRNGLARTKLNSLAKTCDRPLNSPQTCGKISLKVGGIMAPTGWKVVL